uniref:Zf-LYAR domain-containing protein n=1 Tax=Rhodnius prolixus TaxID=13249 RepID=T1HGA2_RHOPR
MVVFTCQKCNSTLKKTAVEKHYSCRPFYLTCIDCLKDFRGKEYDEHKSCITEKQKYGGANVVVKPQGVKQVQWAEMASEVLEEMSHNNRYRKICLALKSSTNIPRNRNKFHNFVNSVCCRIYQHDIANEIFDHLMKAKNNEEESKQNNKNDVPINGIVTSTKKEIDLDESTLHETNIKKMKKKKRNTQEINDTSQPKDVDLKAVSGIKSETEPQTVERNEIINSSVNMRKQKLKALAEMMENPDITIKSFFKIENNKTVEEQNKENEEKYETDVVGKSNQCEEEINNSSGMEPNLEYLETLNKLSKKELKKLKKLKKYNAEVAEVESYQFKYEGAENELEERTKKKKRKHNNTEEVFGSSPKRKLTEEPLEEVEDIGDTLVEEDAPSETRTKFKWGKVIKRILENSSEKEMSLKKLRKKVLNEYEVILGGPSIPFEQLLGIFNKKINSTVGVKVIKDRAQLIQ